MKHRYFMNKKDVSSIRKEVKMGLQVEQEHHKSKSETKQIVKDHLNEDPHYYTKLKRAGL